MVLCQVIIIPRCTTVITCLAVGTVVLTFCCVLVMAEEFPGKSPTHTQQLPASLMFAI